MISLARHIELLLLEHDCVIVPGLGGFIANYADATYTGNGENLYLPPYRTIGFNQQLQVNDGLLVQSYMSTYDTSYPFANLQMEQDLEKILHELDMKGMYELENLGVLKKGINNNISFIAQDASALTPALYGLYSYEILPLQHVIQEREIERNMQAASSMGIANNELAPTNTTKRRDVIIRINRHWLDLGISVAAAVVLFFCFSYPALNNISTETDTVVAAFTPMSNTDYQAPTLSVEKPITKKVATTPSAINKQTVQVAESSEGQIHQTAKHAAPEGAKTATSAPKYAIVLASYVSRTNAEEYIQKLAKSGLEEGRYVKEGKVSRILYSEFQTEVEARAALNTLRQQSTEFAEAWILAL